MSGLGETDSGTPATTLVDAFQHEAIASLDRHALFRLLLEKRIEAARALDNAAALFGLVFETWRCAGVLLSEAWPASSAFLPSDIATLRDDRFGAWVLPPAVQHLLVDGGDNTIGSLEQRELAAWAPVIR